MFQSAALEQLAGRLRWASGTAPGVGLGGEPTLPNTVMKKASTPNVQLPTPRRADRELGVGS